MRNRCILAILAVLLAGCTWLPKHPVLDCSLRPGDTTCLEVLRVAARTFPTATVLRMTDKQSPETIGGGWWMYVEATFPEGARQTIRCSGFQNGPIGCELQS